MWNKLSFDLKLKIQNLREKIETHATNTHYLNRHTIHGVLFSCCPFRSVKLFFEIQLIHKGWEYVNQILKKKNNYLSWIPKPGWKMSKTIFRDESSLQKRSGMYVLHHWKNLNFWASKSVKDPNPISQRKIWDPVNMYDGTFLRKVDSILSLTVFAKKSPSQMFHRVDIGYWTYNLPRFTFVIQACSS